MPRKRKSRGRSKGGKGSGSRVQCDMCGAWVPRDKAKRVTKFVSLVDSQLAKELQKKGAYIPRTLVTKTYCISCAIYNRVVKVRAAADRRGPARF